MQDSSNSTVSCILICCGCPLALGLMAGSIAYYVFGIMYLVDDRLVCKNDQLWVFALIALIAPVLPVMIKSASTFLRYTISDYTQFVLSFIISSITLVYGVLVIYNPGYVCQELKSRGLYVWSLVSFYCLVVGVSLSLCVLPFPSLFKKHTDGNISSEATDNLLSTNP